MKSCVIALLILANQIVFSQSNDSLFERSLQYFDIPAYSGKIEPQPLRLGMYSNEVFLDSNLIIPGIPKDTKGYKIWHLMSHRTADEAGLFIGDTVIGMNGKPLYDSVARGDEFVELQLINKKEGDFITINVLKNGKVIDLKAKLIGLHLVELPVIDPGIGKIRDNTWLKNRIDEFKLKDWTDEIQKQMMTIGSSDYNTVPFSDKPLPWRLNAITYLHHNPTRLGAYSRLIVNDLWNSLESQKNLSKLVEIAAKHLDINIPIPLDVNLVQNKLPSNTDELIKFLEEGYSKTQKAYSKVKDLKETTTQLKRILDIDDNWEGYLDTLKDPVFRKSEVNKQELKLAELFRNCNNIDFPALTEAAAYLAKLIDTNWVNQFGDGSAKNGYISDANIELKMPGTGIEGYVVFYKETKFGKIVIGGKSDNKYTGDFAFILDLGGNDVYELPPCQLGSFRYIIDNEGNDLYQNEKSGQASGIGCIDILFDVKGNDTYRSGYYSQGSGLLGIGILADYAGDDIYTSHWCSQGAAFLGIGILFDLSGSDNYVADVYSQAFGYIKGMGILMEREGNDSYKAGWKITDSRDPKRAHISMSQGYGYGMRPWTLGVHADGGIGVLTDYSEHDVYNADFFSQGGSYWYALGILHDRKGCDRYTAGQYSQGSGIHLSFGALLDDEGNDMYDAYAGLEQGNAHDLSAGCLEDNEGDDTYRGYGSSQGSALTVAFAWLLDGQGNDMYICNPADTTLSQGGGRYNYPRKAGSLGLLLDIGKGTDIYTEPRVEPGKAILKGRKGIIFDDGK
jgi:hypothetical protein